MSLDAHLIVRRGGFTLDAAFAVADGEVLGVLGPNGAGKTTALRALAGLEPLTGGHLSLGGEDLGPVATEDRRVGVVFQDYLLFPHLTALENVAYGSRAAADAARPPPGARPPAGWPRSGWPSTPRTGPGSCPAGRPSGSPWPGRWPPDPRLLLLDEPLAALDAGTRLTLRADLRRHLTSYGGPAVVVTHDAVEAMVLTDQLIVAGARPDRPEWTAGRGGPPAPDRVRREAARPQPLPRHRARRPGPARRRRRAAAGRARRGRGERGPGAVGRRAAPGTTRGVEPAQRLDRAGQRGRGRRRPGPGSRSAAHRPCSPTSPRPPSPSWTSPPAPRSGCR